jgi:CHAD domain-containing protein
MSIRLPTDLLRRSADEGSRLLALAYLDEIGSAERRLADPLDSEALHDFRVGLRRLRSCTRAYRPHLKGSLSKKMRRQLRDLTTATNPGRDTEVKLAWLHRQGARLGAGELEGLGWLIGRQEGRKYEALDRVAGEVARRFLKLETTLRRRLGTFRLEVRTGREEKRPSFGDVTAALIHSHASELAEGLETVVRPEDVTEAHATRIRTKRLRYLLEPISRRAPGVKRLVGRLKQLQDVLGSLHDMHVLAEEIDSSLAALSRSVADQPVAVKPGLLALRRLASEQAGESFANFRAEWSNDRAARFLSRTHDLGTHLSEARAVESGGKAVLGARAETVVAAAVVPLAKEDGSAPSNGSGSAAVGDHAPGLKSRV